MSAARKLSTGNQHEEVAMKNPLGGDTSTEGAILNERWRCFTRALRRDSLLSAECPLGSLSINGSTIVSAGSPGS